MQRTAGHFNARMQRRIEMLRNRRGLKSAQELQGKQQAAQRSTFGSTKKLREVTSHIYTDDEISKFSMEMAIANHPLAGKPTLSRSKLAYQEIMHEVNQSPRYMLPGMFAVFGYKTPKYKAELQYYDATPAVIFFGIVRTQDNTIRELGFNLHYFPPFARGKIIQVVYQVFKQYYNKYFNDIPSRPNTFVDYRRLKAMLDKYKIGFGLRMYIPVLRGRTFILPTRMIPTMSYTEGHFNKATISQIRRYWRKFGR